MIPFINQVYAADSAVNGIIGTVKNPLPSAYSGGVNSGNFGLLLFLTNILRLVFVVAGIFALFNFITAGFTYMQAGGDSKKLGEAWDKIWLSLVGLLVIVGSFALAALFGQLFFNNPGFILNPSIYGPGQ